MTNHTLQLADRVRGLTAPTTFGRVLGVPPEGSVALTSGSPDVGLLPADEIADATAAVIADPVRRARALDYAARPGSLELREWIAAREGVDPSRVFITNGALHAISVSLQSTVNPGDVLVVESPLYPLALSVAQLTGAVVETVPTDAHGLDVDALEAKLSAGLRPAAVYVVPDFQNPSGAVLAPERRVRLVELAERYGFVVVSDNPYATLRWAGEVIPDLDPASDRVIHANTFSKVLGPGLRVGWLVLPEWAYPGAVDIRARTDQHPSSLIQEIVAEIAARRGRFDEIARRATAEYAVRAEALIGGLRDGLGDAIDVATPEGGLFAWVRLNRVGADEFAEHLAGRGILVNPGSQFSPAGTATADTLTRIRLTFARHDADTLRQAARSISEAHHDLEAARR
ncbi:MAG: PLP-dependent aminotransferase family protein [Microbacterium gubbeenense]|uniref:aminotransferase-like domain-containing protein n=1 Tax=Microbacterium gubbeenense TaxID=159896 RepID=UPI003F967589